MNLISDIVGIIFFVWLLVVLIKKYGELKKNTVGIVVIVVSVLALLSVFGFGLNFFEKSFLFMPVGPLIALIAIHFATKNKKKQ